MSNAMVVESATLSTTQQHDTGPGIPVQPGQQLQRSESTRTARGPSLREQGLTRWHKTCQPFLLQTIQRRTECDVNDINLNSAAMAQHIVQHVEQRYYQENCDMSFLGLRLFSNTQTHRPRYPETVNLVRSSTISETSVGSMSSQVSDSFDNDVQQSSQIFMEDLQAVMNGIRPQRGIKRLLRTLAVTGGVTKEEEQAQVLLYNAISDIMKILRDFQSEMHSIGFRESIIQTKTFRS